jgi:hypothetical protein
MMTLYCFLFPWSFLCSVLFLLTLETLIEHSEQSNPELSSKLPDSSSPADFYGLFDSPDPLSGHAEEFKVQVASSYRDLV